VRTQHRADFVKERHHRWHGDPPVASAEPALNGQRHTRRRAVDGADVEPAPVLRQPQAQLRPIPSVGRPGGEAPEGLRGAAPQIHFLRILGAGSRLFPTEADFLETMMRRVVLVDVSQAQGKVDLGTAQRAIVKYLQRRLQDKEPTGLVIMGSAGSSNAVFAFFFQLRTCAVRLHVAVHTVHGQLLRTVCCDPAAAHRLLWRAHSPSIGRTVPLTLPPLGAAGTVHPMKHAEGYENITVLRQMDEADQALLEAVQALKVETPAECRCKPPFPPATSGSPPRAWLRTQAASLVSTDACSLDSLQMPQG